MKRQWLLAVLVIGLGSCTSTVIPSPLPVSTSIPTETFVPTALVTITPTNTSTPTEPSITKTATPEPVPFTSFDEVFISGVNDTGSSIYGNHDDVFHTFTEEPDGFASLHFTMQITEFHFIKNERTPTAIPTERWRIAVYRYRTDGSYVDQPFVGANFTTDVMPYPDRLLLYMTADVSMDEMRTKFGDCSAFAYQMIDGKGQVQQQGSISINPHILFPSGGGLMGDFNDGVTLGFPYSLNERETEFFHQGQFVMFHEPKSGFYRLTYMFNFAQASGVSAVSEMEVLAGKLVIRLFPYREDGKYSASDSYPVIGNAAPVAGIYIVELPIDYLKKNSNGNNKYYLHMEDDRGNTIKDETFEYIPYVP